MLKWKVILKVLAIIESSNNPLAWNESEDAIGIYQIRNCVVEDVNWKFEKEFKHEDCYEVDASKEIFAYYMSMYDATDSYERVFRTWNGGPKGMEKPSTISYWHKAKRLLKQHLPEEEYKTIKATTVNARKHHGNLSYPKEYMDVCKELIRLGVALDNGVIERPQWMLDDLKKYEIEEPPA